MKRWMYAVLIIVVVLLGGFFTVYHYVRSTQAWARTIAVPDPSLAAVADGVYTGSSHLKLPPGTAAANATAEVRVTVKDHRYAAIEVIAPAAIAAGMTEFAAKTVVARQSTRIDGITGATVTKAAVLMAIANAVAGG